MRIAFVWDWVNDTQQTITWKDGLAGALREIQKSHELKIFTCGERGVLKHEYFPIHVSGEGAEVAGDVAEYDPDVILVWGDCTRPSQPFLAMLDKPMALCFAGGNTKADNWKLFDHIFVENEEYRKMFEEQGASCSIAFGTNTELYTPFDAPKSIDYYFPATFADWKRHNLFTEMARGTKSLCVGYMYPVSERYCWEDTMNAGITVAPHVSAEVNRFFMAQSRCVLVTSKNVGGSQRTVLEALSMNIPTIVMADNIKCSEYLIDVGCSDWIVNPNQHALREKLEEILIGAGRDTRSKLMGKWDEETYASRIEDGLMSIL